MTATSCLEWSPGLLVWAASHWVMTIALTILHKQENKNTKDVKRCRYRALYIYLHFCIIPTLFAYFLACKPYIFLLFLFSCFCTFLMLHKQALDKSAKCETSFMHTTVWGWNICLWGRAVIKHNSPKYTISPSFEEPLKFMSIPLLLQKKKKQKKNCTCIFKMLFFKTILIPWKSGWAGQSRLSP